MRVDKFLQVSRLVKRRAAAKEACDAGRVLLNERTAKPGSEVEAGDRITLTWGRRKVRVAVLEVPVRNVPAAQAKTLYEIVEEVAGSSEDDTAGQAHITPR